MNRQALAEAVTQLAQQAGDAIAAIYHRNDAWVEEKPDGSPVTAADIAAQNVIVSGLNQLTPDIPIISEESTAPDWEERRHWSRYWLVDPLDGTKEFVARSGEFTVNIALMENNQPTLGVVVAPIPELTFLGSGNQAWRITPSQRVSINTTSPQRPWRLVVSSRSHGPRLRTLRQLLEQQRGQATRQDLGSSLKMCAIAAGQADIYPRFGPTSEWDTAAADAILRAAGGVILQKDFTPLVYNKPSLLNPDFVALSQAADWPDLSAAWQAVNAQFAQYIRK